MGHITRRATIVGAAAVLSLLGFTGTALAGDYHEPPTTTKAKCNAGNGNGSEPTANTGNCTNGDPGNSYNAGNRGGDEIPSSGGVENPGGNNVD
jgi:hypothetical protein